MTFPLQAKRAHVVRFMLFWCRLLVWWGVLWEVVRCGVWCVVDMHTFIDNTKYTKSITIHHTCHWFEFIMEQSSITQRSYGEEVNNSCLPKKVPIVGLGCSCFSNSFVKNADDMDTCLSCNQNSAHLLPRTHQKVKEWIQTIKHAVDNGINLLDTAPWYGHG